MKTQAVRLYGKNDLRLETFELPAIQDDEILAKIVTDSLCVSSYKAVNLGTNHKRVPNDIAKNPIIVGHEFCGELVQIGKKWQSDFTPGSMFTVQPALNYKGSLDAPGYSFRSIGGDATYVIIPNVVMEQNCLLPFESKAFFLGSLSEPLSCVIGACNSMYHVPQGTYNHIMGIKDKSNLALLAGTGPMGFSTIDYCIHGPRRPSLLVVTSRNAEKLHRAQKIHTTEEARRHGVNLVYLYTPHAENTTQKLLEIHNQKYDDVFVMAADTSLVKIADDILAKDGCLNFFAGPTNPQFSAPFNFYNVHYNFTHVVSNSGGNTDDMREALALMTNKSINPASLITHIGGLNCVVETTKNLPNIPGSKKLIYTHKNIPLTALSDCAEKGRKENTMFFTDLAQIIQSNNDMWCVEAEQYVLKNAEELSLQ